MRLPQSRAVGALDAGLRYVTADHAGKPPIASGDPRAWRADLARLLLAADYGAVWSAIAAAMGDLDSAGQTAVLGGTAARWYQIAVR